MLFLYFQTRGDNYEPLRFSADHMIFQRLADIVVSGITLSLGGMWVPMAEEAINVIYHLAEHPDEICGNLIKSLIFKIFGSQTNIGGGDEYSQKGNSRKLMMNTMVIMDGKER